MGLCVCVCVCAHTLPVCQRFFVIINLMWIHTYIKFFSHVLTFLMFIHVVSKRAIIQNVFLVYCSYWCSLAISSKNISYMFLETVVRILLGRDVYSTTIADSVLCTRNTFCINCLFGGDNMLTVFINLI